MPSYLIVVNNPERWKLHVGEAQVVAARSYLTDPTYSSSRRFKVLNLCRSYKYQSLGYYVSLLAEARGHRPMPSVSTIQDFRSQSIIRNLAAETQDLIQKSLTGLQSDKFTLSIYFARNLARRYDRLCRALFNLFPAPLLRANFTRDEDGWHLQTLSPISSSEIPEGHREFVLEAARDYLMTRSGPRATRKPFRYEIAMLVDPEEATPPSNEQALKRFERAAAEMRLHIERITKEDYGDLGEYDGLFIRATTAVNNYTYRFARMAQSSGMVVIDDPLSILRCTNKVYLFERLAQARLPMPKTMVVHRDNLEEALRHLGLPIILKQPDSSFSQGVSKAESREEFIEKVTKLFEDSELLIAQEFLPTQFDWRIGVIDGEAFYACRYEMANGHWQIYNHKANGDEKYGMAEAMPIEHVPDSVRDIATRAARLMGEGLYGVDLKEIDGKAYLIEVNDNPNLDADVEDKALGMELYARVLRTFLKRLEARHRDA